MAERNVQASDPSDEVYGQVVPSIEVALAWALDQAEPHQPG